MKNYFEYKLYKSQLRIYLIVWASLVLIYGLSIMVSLLADEKHGDIISIVLLIAFVLSSIVVIPIIIYTVYTINRMKNNESSIEIYDVECKNMHRFLFGYYFTFQVKLSSGRIVNLSTKSYFRNYGIRNYENFLNKKIRIGYLKGSEYAIVIGKC